MSTSRTPLASSESTRLFLFHLNSRKHSWNQVFMQEGVRIFLGQSLFCLFDLLSLCTVFFFWLFASSAVRRNILFKMDSAFINQDV